MSNLLVALRLKTIPLLCCLVATGCAWAPGAYLVPNPSALLAPSPKTYELVDLARAPDSVLKEISASPVPQTKSAENAIYRINIGDHLAVTLWSVPEFEPSTAFGATFSPLGRTVEPDGSIFLPYAGNVQVAGLTIAEAREVVTSALRKTVKDPQFDLRPAGRAYLMGEFLRNQPMAITDTFTLADAMAEAAGVIQLASNGSIFLIRPRGNDEPLVYWLKLDDPRSASLATQILVRSKDVIYAGASDLARFNRVVSNLLPGLGAASSIGNIQYQQSILRRY